MLIDAINNQTNDRLIFLIINICLIVAVLIVASINFFVNYYLNRKIKTFSQLLNNIYHQAILNKFKYLESLAKNNPELLELFENLTKANTNFIEQIKIVKTKIEKLNYQKQKYQWYQAFRLIKTIQNDLEKSQNLIQKIRKFANVSTDYNRSVSELLVDFRTIAEELINFYYHNLSTIYKINDINQAIDSIKKELIDSNLLSLKINNQELVSSIKSIHKNIDNFYYLIDHCYQVHLAILYLKNLDLTLKDFQVINDNKLLLEDVMSLLNQNEIIQAKEKLLKEIFNTETKFNAFLKDVAREKLINFSMQNFQKIFQTISSDWNNLFNNFRNIYQDYFQFDLPLKKYFYTLNKQWTKIYKNYQLLEQINPNEQIKNIAKIKTLTNKIEAFLQNLIDFKQKLIDQYELIKNQWLQAYQLDTILKYLLDLKTKLNSNDQKLIQEIKQAIDLNQNNIKKIKTNFWALQNEIMNHHHYLDKQIHLFSDSVISDLTMKSYNERLLFFANQYRNDNKYDAEFVLIEDAYSNQKYQSSIDLLLEIIKKAQTTRKTSKKRRN